MEENIRQRLDAKMWYGVKNFSQPVHGIQFDKCKQNLNKDATKKNKLDKKKWTVNLSDGQLTDGE